VEVMPSQNVMRIYMAAFEKLHEDMADLLGAQIFEQATIVARFDLMVDGFVMGETQTMRGAILPACKKDETVA
jgi:hypothetical protein